MSAFADLRCFWLEGIAYVFLGALLPLQLLSLSKYFHGFCFVKCLWLLKTSNELLTAHALQ